MRIKDLITIILISWAYTGAGVLLALSPEYNFLNFWLPTILGSLSTFILIRKFKIFDEQEKKR